MSLIDRLYSSKEGIDLSEFDFKDLIHPNECFVLKSDRNTVLARYNPFTHSICRVMKGKNYGIEPRNAEQSFAFEILNDPNVKLVALTGRPEGIEYFDRGRWRGEFRDGEALG